MELTAVVAARPNIVKMAPLVRGLEALKHSVTVVHTGQHYSEEMSRGFFDDLGIHPSFTFNSGRSLNRAKRIGYVCAEMGSYFERRPSDACIVAGDVDSTLGAAMGARFSGIPLVHLESGLRSRNWGMPEEMNRYATDHISDLLLCTSPDAAANLDDEAVFGRVTVPGNTMIDSVVRVRQATEYRDRDLLRSMHLYPREYILCTFHRPSLVDDDEAFDALIEALHRIEQQIAIVLVLHPRVYGRVSDVGDKEFIVAKALPYESFLALQANAKIVVTDSGGVQEESSFLGVTCLTFRTETERPITVRMGTNRVIGTDPHVLEYWVKTMIATPDRRRLAPIPRWDGAAGPRAARMVHDWMGKFPHSHTELDYPYKVTH